MPHFGKTHDFRAMFWRTAMVSDPVRKGWWGYRLVFDRIYRINRIEGDGRRNAEGAEITQRARRNVKKYRGL